MSDGFIDRKLSVHVLEDILVTPLLSGSGKVSQQFSVVGGDASSMEHRRAARGYSITKIDVATEELDYTVIDDDCLYAGPLFNHFGHFIAESIPRLWAFVENESKRLPFIAFHPFPLGRGFANELYPWMIQALSLFGIDKSSIIFIDKNIKFKKLLVPEQGSVLGAGPISRQYIDCIQKINDSTSSEKRHRELRSGKIYISRSKHAFSGSYLGERLIEKLLKNQAGFEIIYPE